MSELSDDELMRLFVALTRWTDFYAGQLAMAEVEMTYSDQVLEQVKATVLLRKWASATKDDRVTIAKAEVLTDPDVDECQGVYDTAYARKKMLAVYFENAERDAAVVSRELTRRVGRKESNERRADRWKP